MGLRGMFDNGIEILLPVVNHTTLGATTGDEKGEGGRFLSMVPPAKFQYAVPCATSRERSAFPLR